MEDNEPMDNEIEALEKELDNLKKLKTELTRIRDVLTYFRRDLEGVAANQHLLIDINSAWSELASLASRVSLKS